MGLMSATVASYVYFLGYLRNPMFSLFGVFGSLFGIHSYAATRQNENIRRVLFVAFTFFDGLTIGPLVNLSMSVDPSLITNAFFYTFAIFACFSFSALRYRRRSMLFLGGLLSSLTLGLLLAGLANIFFRSQALFSAELYIGLFAFCGYVMYDTQLIVERCEAGRYDVVGDSLQLFIDMFAMFVRILAILTRKEEKKRKE